MDIAVITWVPDPRKSMDEQSGHSPLGNLANGPELWIDPDPNNKDWNRPLKSVMDKLLEDTEHNNYPYQLAGMYFPVFHVGEILVLDEWERDTLGRKPSKWDIEYDIFDNIEDAYKKAKEVS